MTTKSESELKNIPPACRRVREARHAAGMSLMGLARLADSHISTIHRIEMGFGEPELPTLRKLAAALGVTLRSLVDDGPWEHVPAKTRKSRKQ